jgi:hypothetical protein
MVSDEGAAALEALFWRDEILQALYWLQGERLAEAVDAERMAGLLVADLAIVKSEMGRLAEGGYLDVLPGLTPGSALRFRLTEIGRMEGARSFKDEFDGLTRQAHGECGPGCWCNDPRRIGEPCPASEPPRDPTGPERPTPGPTRVPA